MLNRFLQTDIRAWAYSSKGRSCTESFWLGITEFVIESYDCRVTPSKLILPWKPEVGDWVCLEGIQPMTLPGLGKFPLPISHFKFVESALTSAIIHTSVEVQSLHNWPPRNFTTFSRIQDRQRPPSLVLVYRKARGSQF